MVCEGLRRYYVDVISERLTDTSCDTVVLDMTHMPRNVCALLLMLGLSTSKLYYYIVITFYCLLQGELVGSKQDNRVVISVKDTPVAGKDLGKKIQITSDDQRDFNNLIKDDNFHLLDIILTGDEPIINTDITGEAVTGEQEEVVHSHSDSSGGGGDGGGGSDDVHYITIKDEHEGEDEVKKGWFASLWEDMGQREAEIAQNDLDEIEREKAEHPQEEEPPLENPPEEEPPMEHLPMLDEWQIEGEEQHEEHHQPEQPSTEEGWEEVPVGEFFDQPQNEYIEQTDNHIEDWNPEFEQTASGEPKYLEEWVDSIEDQIHFIENCHD